MRPEHSKQDYPGLVASNFINSQMARKEEIKILYERKFGKKWEE